MNLKMIWIYCKKGGIVINLDKKTEDELEEAIAEQNTLRSIEVLAGNVVKEEFHKGALFGIRLALGVLGLVEKDLTLDHEA